MATVIENLEDLSVDEVIEQFDVTREQVTAVPRFRSIGRNDRGPCAVDVYVTGQTVSGVA